jgi:hypothetical protein
MALFLNLEDFEILSLPSKLSLIASLALLTDCQIELFELGTIDNPSLVVTPVFRAIG